MKNFLSSEFNSKNKNILSLIAFILFIFTLWSIYILYLDSFFKSNTPFFYRLFHLGLDKLLLMTLPAYFYLDYYEKVNIVKFLKLDSNILAGIKYVILSIAFLIILSLNTQYQLLNYIKFNPFLSISIWIDAIILAAFMDEVIFRGIVLQKLTNVMIFRKANVLSSLIFVFIHFPKWFSLGYFSHYTVIGSINFIFVFGLLMGYIFKKSNSLWPCIFIHLTNNFISYALNL